MLVDGNQVEFQSRLETSTAELLEGVQTTGSTLEVTSTRLPIGSTMRPTP